MGTVSLRCRFSPHDVDDASDYILGQEHDEGLRRHERKSSDTSSPRPPLNDVFKDLWSFPNQSMTYFLISHVLLIKIKALPDERSSPSPT